MSIVRSFMLSLLLFVQVVAVNANGDGLQPHEGHIAVKGGNIWYRVFGEGKGTPIMMLHGGPGGTSKSFYQFAELGKDRPIVVFDQLGGGRSDQHTDSSLLTIDNFVEQVEAVRKKLQLTSFFLHGHSWGTALALEYYLKYPAAVKGISFNGPYFSTAMWKADADTLIATLPETTQQAIRAGEELKRFDNPAYQEANSLYASRFGTRTFKKSSPLDIVPAQSNKFIYQYMWGPTEFTATGTLLNYDRVAELKQIKVPTLFITGEFDEARPATVSYFQSLVPGAGLAVIPGAGHSTMHDNLPANLKALREFLRAADR